MIQNSIQSNFKLLNRAVKKSKQIIFAVSVVSFLSVCQPPGMVKESKEIENLLAGLAIGQNFGQNSEANKDFLLNGQWDSFTGNGTTKDTILTITAKFGSIGITLTDATTYSSCGIIHSFDNNTGYYISQNPPNNGICPNGFTDASKGKYFKNVFFKNTEKTNSYWTCTVNATGVTTEALALSIVDTTNKTNPGSSGCSGFSWSRIEKR